MSSMQDLSTFENDGDGWDDDFGDLDGLDDELDVTEEEPISTEEAPPSPSTVPACECTRNNNDHNCATVPADSSSVVREPYTCPCISKFLLEKENVVSAIDDDVEVDYNKLLREEIAKRMLLEQELQACHKIIDSLKQGKSVKAEKQSEIQPEETLGQSDDETHQQGLTNDEITSESEALSTDNVEAKTTHDGLVIKVLETIDGIEKAKNTLVSEQHPSKTDLHQLIETVDILSSEVSQYKNKVTHQHDKDVEFVSKARNDLGQQVKQRFDATNMYHQMLQSMALRMSLRERELQTLQAGQNHAINAGLTVLQTLGKESNDLLSAQQQALTKVSELHENVDRLSLDLSQQTQKMNCASEEKFMSLKRERDELRLRLRERQTMTQSHHHLLQSMALKVFHRDGELQALRSQQHGNYKHCFLMTLEGMKHLSQEKNSSASAQHQSLTKFGELEKSVDWLSSEFSNGTRLLTNLYMERLAASEMQLDSLRLQLTERCLLTQGHHRMIKNLVERVSRCEDELRSLRTSQDGRYEVIEMALENMRLQSQGNYSVTMVQRQAMEKFIELNGLVDRLSQDCSVLSKKYLERMISFEEERNELRLQLRQRCETIQKYHEVLQSMSQRMNYHSEELQSLYAGRNSEYRYLEQVLDDMKLLQREKTSLVMIQRRGYTEIAEMNNQVGNLSSDFSKNVHRLTCYLQSLTMERDQWRSRLTQNVVLVGTYHKMLESASFQIGCCDEQLESLRSRQSGNNENFAIALEAMKYLGLEKKSLTAHLHRVVASVNVMNEGIGRLSSHFSHIVSKYEEEVASLSKERDELRVKLTQQLALVPLHNRMLQSIASRVSTEETNFLSRSTQLDAYVTRALETVLYLGQEKLTVFTAQQQSQAQLRELHNRVGKLTSDVTTQTHQLVGDYEEKTGLLVQERDELRMQLTQKFELIQTYHRIVQCMASRISVCEEKLQALAVPGDSSDTVRALEAVIVLGNERNYLASVQRQALVKFEELNGLVNTLASDVTRQTHMLTWQHRDQVNTLNKERNELQLQLSQTLSLLQLHHRALRSMASKASLRDGELESIRDREQDAINEGAKHLRRCLLLEEELSSVRQEHATWISEIQRHAQTEKQLRTELDTLVEERDTILQMNEQLESDNEEKQLQIGLLRQECESRDADVASLNARVQTLHMEDVSHGVNASQIHDTAAESPLPQQDLRVVGSENLTQEEMTAVPRLEEDITKLWNSNGASDVDALNGDGSPMEGTTEQKIASLALALQRSEMARAEAIDKLMKERSAHADSIRRLGESMKRFYASLSSANT